MKKRALGYNIVVDLFDCNPQKIDDREFVRSTMLEAAKVAKASIITDIFHSFNPQGLSGVVVIAESHIAIHSWPEFGCVAIDIFSCSEKLEHEKAIEYLKQAFEARKATVAKTERGLIVNSMDVKKV